MVSNSNALAQLSEGRIVQSVSKFWLSHQHNLQQFVIVRLEIGQKPHLFEQFIGQILGFVDDENAFASFLNLLQEEKADVFQRLQAVEASRVQTEFNGDGPHQLVGVEHRVQNQG